MTCPKCNSTNIKFKNVKPYKKPLPLWIPIILFIITFFSMGFASSDSPEITPYITVLSLVTTISFLAAIICCIIRSRSRKKQFYGFNIQKYRCENCGYIFNEIDYSHQDRTNPDGPIYTRKKLMTHTEFQYEQAILECLPKEYILRPQVCLASIIKKNESYPFVNELFRIIDFCVFDKYSNAIFLIEINDETHNEWKRKQRDAKVKDICAYVNLPLITFWTSYGIDKAYIKKRINQTLSDLSNISETSFNAFNYSLTQLNENEYQEEINT